MSRRHVLLLVVLASIWGASFMFIKVADRQLSPLTLVAGRIGLAALTLTVVVPFLLGARTTLRDLRRHAGALVVVGLVNTAVPFLLLTWGETRIDSGLAAIIQAAVPIFTAVFAFGFFPAERVTGIRLLGVAVGFVGVALLVGAQPHGQLLGALAVVGMATFYAVGGLLAGRLLQGVPPPIVSLGSCWAAFLAVAGPGAAAAPSHVPGWKTIASVVVLGVLGTAVAYLVFFVLVAGAGASRATLVTYLVPPIALAYGAVVLDERVGAVAIAAFLIILGGVVLAARGRRGSRRLGSRRGAVPAHDGANN